MSYTFVIVKQWQEPDTFCDFGYETEGEHYATVDAHSATFFVIQQRLAVVQ